MKDRYDVIVAGAGPAGSLAARTAAENGLSVLLVEKRQEIGEPVRCAEGITADGLREFMEPDPKWVCGHIRRATFFTPGTRLAFTDDRDAAYILDRKIFDRELARQAAMAGADVLTKTQATGVILEDGQVKGITGRCAGENFEARAAVVVAADGIESKVGRWAGIDTTLAVKDLATCVQYHLTDIDFRDGDCEFYFGGRWVPGGYAYVFPKGTGEANVGLGKLCDSHYLRRTVEYLDDFVRWRFPGAHVLETTVGGVPLRGRIPRLSAAGLVLAGDAGRLTDPVTGEGILNAMISGRTAGTVIADCLRKGDASAGALLQYDREIGRLLGAALDRNYGLKEFLRKAGDAKLDRVARGFKAVRVENIPVTRLLREIYSPHNRRAASLLGMLTGSL